MLKPVLVVESKSIPNVPLDHSKCSRFVLLARQYQASVDVPVINDTKKNQFDSEMLRVLREPL